MTYRDILKSAEAELLAANVPDPVYDSRLLFKEAFGLDGAQLLLKLSETAEFPEAPELARFHELINRRAQREPLQYILGETEFMGLTFKVNEHVLIPRQDTEALVEQVLADVGADWLTGCLTDGISDRQAEYISNQRPAGLTLLDMCTGSGCIGISLGCLGPFSKVVCSDISEDALAVAEENCRRLESCGPNGKSSGDGPQDCVPDRQECEFEFILSDLFEADYFKGDGRHRPQFDIIVSNPPYIRSEDIGLLQEEVRDHEPILALDGDEDGLIFYRKIAQSAADYLCDNGSIYFEIGNTQALDVTRILTEAGFGQISVFRDLSGQDRVVRGVLCR